jgi:hypothetical protein
MTTLTNTNTNTNPVSSIDDGASGGIPPDLDQLIARVERHQERLALSDERFVARYKRHLKTVDSWVRTLRKRDPERLTARNIGRWTNTLRGLLVEIDGSSREESIIKTLPILRAAVSLYDRIQGAEDDRRVAWLIGQTGTGKSVSLRYLRRLSPADTCLLIADPTWNGSRSIITRELAAALGVAQRGNAADTLSAVVEQLNSSPATVLVDEFHEGGILLFKLIKTLVNKCPGVKFILATLPTAYARMLGGGRDTYEETRQLRRRSIGLVRKAWADGVRVEDIDAYIAASAPEIPDEERPIIAKNISRYCREMGLALLADAVAVARAAAEAADKPLTDAHILAAAARLSDEV